MDERFWESGQEQRTEWSRALLRLAFAFVFRLTSVCLIHFLLASSSPLQRRSTACKQTQGASLFQVVLSQWGWFRSPRSFCPPSPAPVWSPTLSGTWPGTARSLEVRVSLPASCAISLGTVMASWRCNPSGTGFLIVG